MAAQHCEAGTTLWEGHRTEPQPWRRADQPKILVHLAAACCILVTVGYRIGRTREGRGGDRGWEKKIMITLGSPQKTEIMMERHAEGSKRQGAES